MGKAAVFLDRDKTLIEDPGYLADPNEVRLMPGAAAAVRRWNEAGLPVVLVTNQSGLARGLITEKQLEDIHTQLELLLEDEEASLDGIYYCPYLDGPEAIVPKFRRQSDLRKPGAEMLIQARKDLDIDLDNSWMVGDRKEDMQAGRAAGCKTILVSDSQEPPEQAEAHYVAVSLSQAADIILNGAEEAQASKPEIAADIDMDSSPATQGDSLGLLRDIRSLLQQQTRQNAQKDFSLARLGATLFQFVAIAVLLWGLAAFFGGQENADWVALPRFILAGVIQLFALSLYVSDRGN